MPSMPATIPKQISTSWPFLISLLSSIESESNISASFSRGGGAWHALSSRWQRWWTTRNSSSRPHRCERCEKIHKARCCNHLRLLNGQLGQLRPRVIVKHQTPEGRRAAGREAGAFNCFPNFGLGFDSHRPLHKTRWINWLYPADYSESDAKMDRFGLKFGQLDRIFFARMEPDESRVAGSIPTAPTKPTAFAALISLSSNKTRRSNNWPEK